MGIRSKIKKKLPIFGQSQPKANMEDAEVTNSDMTNSEELTQEDVGDSNEMTGPDNIRGSRDAMEFIDQIIKNNEIVIFMKGTPMQPMCGFSYNAAGILSTFGKPFAHVDVIADAEVRQAIKEYSQWPTLPQVYINQEFIGGSDILTQMYQDGSLKSEIDAAFAK